MSFRQMVGALLLNVIAGAIIGAALIGLFGFLAAGRAGIANGLIFGAAFGTIGGIGATAYVGYAFWEGFAHRLGAKLRDDDEP